LVTGTLQHTGRHFGYRHLSAKVFYFTGTFGKQAGTFRLAGTWPLGRQVPGQHAGTLQQAGRYRHLTARRQAGTWPAGRHLAAGRQACTGTLQHAGRQAPGQHADTLQQAGRQVGTGTLQQAGRQAPNRTAGTSLAYRQAGTGTLQGMHK
jgi:hypothetical protein